MDNTKNSVLSFSELRIGYITGKLRKELTAPLCASTNGGELIALLGRNGIGKSTLLRTLTGIQESLGGDLLLYGRHISEYKRMDIAKKTGYISTEIVRASNMTVSELVALGRFPHTNWLGKIDHKSREIISSSLVKTGMKGFANRNISELSDGERQKAMIARLLAQDTKLMIMDEPTAFLDISSKFEIINLLHELTREGRTVIFSTHDFNVALNHADKIWLISEKGMFDGAPEDLILNNSFDHLFKSPVIGFNYADGSFNFIKTTGKTISLSGKGKNRIWTEKALIRAGYKVVDNSSEIKIKVPDKEEKRWVLTKSESVEFFNSIYELVNRLRG